MLGCWADWSACLTSRSFGSCLLGVAHGKSFLSWGLLACAMGDGNLPEPVLGVSPLNVRRLDVLGAVRMICCSSLEGVAWFLALLVGLSRGIWDLLRSGIRLRVLVLAGWGPAGPFSRRKTNSWVLEIVNVMEVMLSLSINPISV